MKEEKQAPRVEIHYISEEGQSAVNVIYPTTQEIPGKITEISQNKVKIIISEEEKMFPFILQKEDPRRILHLTYDELFEVRDLCCLAILNNSVEAKKRKFFPPFRVGNNHKRAVLDCHGHEVVLFPVGCEYLAADYVERLNKDNKAI